MVQMSHKPRIGLALGSGAARGWAHIGVVRVLRAHGYEIGWVAGTSMGAVVGAAVAGGRLNALEYHARRLTATRVAGWLDPVVPLRGFIGGDRIERLLARLFSRRTTVDALGLPFAAVAADLANGAEVHLRTGAVVDALRASIAVPGLFVPAERGGRYLLDGGLVNPVPVDLCRALGAPLVIAVDLNHDIVESTWHTPETSPTSPTLSTPAPVLTNATDSSRPPDATDPPHLFDLIHGSNGDRVAAPTGADQIGPSPSFLSQAGDLAGNLAGDLAGELAGGLDRGLAALDRIQDALRDAYDRVEDPRAWVRQRLADTRPNLVDVIGGAIDIMERRVTQVNLATHPPDLLIEPPLGHLSMWDFACAEEAIEAGRAATEAALAGWDGTARASQTDADEPAVP